MAIKLHFDLIFERIAQRRYQDPNLGILLRQLNPTRLDIKPGSALFIPPEAELRQLAIEPVSHIMRKTDEQQALFELISEDRLG